MKKLITAFGLVLMSAMGYSQYYQASYLNIGRNPMGLNTDEEQTAGVLNPKGWVTVQSASTTPTWSANQTLPFAFNFNNSAVTSYKVSSTGILTFDVASTVAAPSDVNATLPSALIPDKSVVLWGINGFGGNDAILSKTWGTAPYRQHWVMFSSYSATGGTGWTYWGIALEETTNRIFIVDMRNYNTPLTLTLGVQINSTTATMVAGSPNIAGVNLNGGSNDFPDDNSYYEFGYGTQPTTDAELLGFTLPNLLANNSSTTLSGEVINAGSAALTSFTIKYTVNGGAAVSETFTGQSINVGAKGSFTLSAPYMATSPGNKDFVMWVEAPNNGTDARPYNDTMKVSTAVSAGGSGTKRVLLEEFTTAPCQFCPDGEVVVNSITAAHPEVISVGIHAGFGTDAMTIPAHSAYAGAFATGAPTAAIDRVLFPGETKVGHSRGNWAANAASQKTVLTPVDVTVTGAQTGTNTVDIVVDIAIKDVVPAWQNANVTLFVVEDSVTGTGSGYNQVNYYNTISGHPYFGAGNPIVGYHHRNVVRAVPTGTWGDNTFFASVPVVNNTVSKTYSVTLDPSWDKTQMSFVAFVNYYNAATGEADREVLNVNNVLYSALASVGIEEANTTLNNLNVFPNPTRDLVNVTFDLIETETVSVEVMNVLGEVVSVENYGSMNKGAQKLQVNLNNEQTGIYFVKINTGDTFVTRKVSLLK